EFDEKWQKAKQKIDQRLVGNKSDRPHDGEGHCPAQTIEPEYPPAHKTPPLERPPSIGKEQDDREQDHAASEVQKEQRQDEQHKAASEPKHARQERAPDNGGPDQGKGQKRHFGRDIRTRANPLY